MFHQAMRLVSFLSLLVGSVAVLCAAPLTGVTLSADPPGQCLAGRAVTLTATPTGGSSVEYRFFKVFGGVTTTIQPYTLGADTVQLNPTELGPYQFIVWAREQGSAAKVYASVVHKVNPPLSAVNLTAGPAWPQPPGTPLTLTATQVDGGQIEYRFYIAEPGGALTMVRPYAASNTYAFTPTQQGIYQFLVYAREIGSTATKQAYKSITYNVATPITGVDLTATPPSPGMVNAPVALTATAQGGLKVQYRFFVITPAGQTVTLQNYAVGDNLCDYTPTALGRYTFIVWVRETYSTKPGKDAYRALTYTVTTGPVSVALSPSSATLCVLTTQQFTATVIGVVNTAVTWRVMEEDGGTISGDGLYTAPATPGIYLVEAASVADPTAKALATVTVEYTSSVNPVDGATMVWVPGGTFTMGTPYGNWWDGPATQQVTLSGYWIYQYEVTVAQYRAFCAATGRALPSFPSGLSWAGKSGWADPALQQHPIVNVTWYDAKAYADWAGVTLPTEAQWEYAARGPQGNNFPWGGTATADDPSNGWDSTKCANLYNSHNVGKSTWPVGSFPAGASWCGAHDLAGNVWEWCADWYGNYSTTPVTNPTGPATGSYRVMRGCSFGFDSFRYFRGAYRNNLGPGGWNRNYGFRCVSVSPGP